VTLSPAVVDFANFLIPASIFAILALGLNLQWGHTGIFNAGVAAFLAVGTYTTAILITAPAPMTDQYPGHLGGFSWPFWAAAFAAMLLAGLTGLVIAIPILRLRADYFAIATLALAETIRLILVNARGLTGGTIGVLDIPRPFDRWTVGDPGLSDAYLAALAAGLLLMAFLGLEYLTRSPWGRVLRGIREDEEATLALGKNTMWFRLQAFVIGCAVMGLAGAILAPLVRFLEPNQFDPLATFAIYVMVILGGSGNNRGVIFGAFLFYSFDWVSVRVKDYLPEVIEAKIAPIRLIVIGLLLVLLVMFRPEGLLKEKKNTYPPVTR
jgi:branched-chain amino acid transport system permease protein